MQDVDDPGQLVLAADREVDGDAALGELLLELAECAEEVGALAVEHVHEDEAREPELLGALPHPAGADLDAHHPADDDERALDHAQRRPRLALEARVARNVDQVQLPSLPVGVRERERDRHLPALLVVVPVGDRRARVDRAEAVQLTGLEEHRLDERGLAGAAVADDGDVANLSGLECGHAGGPPRLSWVREANPSRATPRAELAGRMFWLPRKRLSGSYCAFTAASRSYASPNAARTRSSPSSPTKLR